MADFNRQELAAALKAQGLVGDDKIEGVLDALEKSTGVLDADPLVKALRVLKDAQGRETQDLLEAERAEIADDLLKSTTALEGLADFSDRMIDLQKGKSDAMADLLRELSASIVDLRDEVQSMRSEMGDIRDLMGEVDEDMEEVKKSLSTSLDQVIPPRAVRTLSQLSFEPHASDLDKSRGGAPLSTRDLLIKARAAFDDPAATQEIKKSMGRAMTLLEAGANPAEIQDQFFGGC